ncbi:MAG: phytanoyl-CoA dioxygenase family protein [Chloroflexota bacterium]
MTPEIALQKREQMIQDGYCVVDDILTETFLQELRDETERLMENHEPPPDVRYQGQHVNVHRSENEIINRLLDWDPTWQALRQLGFGDFKSTGGVIILTKDPGEPALYWHQDWMQWNDPMSLSPWPQIMFVSYYLTDTSVDNGCLKVIPGTHQNRIPLHDQLVPAHEKGARFIEENHPIMFSDHPDQVNVTVKAGSLVLADARVLHAAHKNLTDERRTLVLAWHKRPNTVPDYWDGPIPKVIDKRDDNQTFEGSRIPLEYLK